MTLDDVRALVTAHAETCLDPSCWRLKHALDSAQAAEAMRLIQESVDPEDRTTLDIAPWSEVTRPWPAVPPPEDN